MSGAAPITLGEIALALEAMSKERPSDPYLRLLAAEARAGRVRLNVYVLVTIECYEDHDVIGAYASEEAARRALDQINANRDRQLKEKAVEAVGSIEGPQRIARWSDGRGDAAYIERHTLDA